MQFSHKWCIYAIIFNINYEFNFKQRACKRAEKALKEFDDNLYIECLEKTARTANDAAKHFKLQGRCYSQEFVI